MALPVKSKAKVSLNTSAFSTQVVSRCLLACLHIRSEFTFSVTFLSRLLACKSPSCCPLHALVVSVPAVCGFPNSILACLLDAARFPGSCPCFHFLYTSFLCLSSAGNCLFHQPGLLPYLPISPCNYDGAYLCFKGILFEDQL